MKKITALLCALVLAIGAFALPANRKAAPVEPIKKAAQADYQYTSPVNFVAINNEGSAGDYVIYLYDANGTLMALADINTGNNNSLAGVYNVGTEGGQSYPSALYSGGQKYAVNYGRLSLTYRGKSAETDEDIYDLVASGWEVSDGQNVSSYKFAGTVSGYAAWKTYYSSCTNNQTDCDKARITLTETAPSTVAEISCFGNNIEVDQSKITSNEYWILDGTGYNEQGTAAYELYVTLYGDQLAGSYTKDDVATYENGNLAAGLYTSTNPSDQNSWTEIELSQVYGTVTQESNVAYRMDFYAVDKSNKVYHFVMFYGYTTSNTMMYDCDKDFHAAFALESMTPLTTTNCGTYNGLQYFNVEVQSATQYANLLFFAQRTDEVITIPAGRYSVSSNNVAGTMQAGEIMEEGGQAFANSSYAADIVSGNMLDNYRFIVDGTAEVQNANGNLYIVVKGTNTFYRIVELTIGTPPVTGFEEINMNVVQDGQKMMIDGQLYIKRGENLYNAQGAVVK
ncbi:MAG: hypothetical protein K5660_04195 [Paludibacteraceae bacterium]|nr:hypothetical protein [Paludibacteraceae bacterium]